MLPQFRLATAGTHLPDPFDTVQSTDLDAALSPTNSGARAAAQPRDRGASYYGRETVLDASAARADASAARAADRGEGYDLNFENAPVTAVAKVDSRRHSRGRLYHRSACARDGDDRVRQAGSESATLCWCSKMRCA